MKKVFLTAVVALSSLAMSAQSILITTELAEDAEGSYSFESLTNNIGIGYEVMDKITIGISMKDATMNTAAVDAVAADSAAGIVAVDAVDAIEDGTIVSEMQIFARYAVSDDLFVQMMAPMSSDIEGVNANDLMRVGVGYKFNVWNDVNAEFSYSMLVSENGDADRKGQMAVGVSMGF